MQGHGEALRRRGLQGNRGPLEADPRHLLPPEGGRLLLDQALELHALPAAFRQQGMGQGQGLDAAADRSDEFRGRLGLAQIEHGLNDGEQILGPVVDLPHEQGLLLVGLLALRDVQEHAGEAHGAGIFLADQLSGGKGPANGSVRPAEADLAALAAGALGCALDQGQELLAILKRHMVQEFHEAAALGIRGKPDHLRQARRPPDLAGIQIAIAPAHMGRIEGELQALLLLAQLGRGGLQGGRPLRDPLLQLAVQPLELAALAIELGEDLDLGPENLRDHRHRDIVDGPDLIAPEEIEIGQKHGRNEDDRGLLEARVLADHARELEAVEVGHVDIHQHDGDIGAQKMVEGLAGGIGDQEILAQFLEDGFVGQQLCRLVIDQQDIDLVVPVHISPLQPTCAARGVAPTAAARY